MSVENPVQLKARHDFCFPLYQTYKSGHRYDRVVRSIFGMWSHGSVWLMYESVQFCICLYICIQLRASGGCWRPYCGYGRHWKRWKEILHTQKNTTFGPPTWRVWTVGMNEKRFIFNFGQMGSSQRGFNALLWWPNSVRCGREWRKVIYIVMYGAAGVGQAMFTFELF